MWKATIRGVLARKVRLALTALAVLLGVSFVAATYVLTDTLDRSFTQVFDDTVTGVDLVVRQRAPFDGETDRDRFPDSLLDEIRAVDGVREATGFLQDYAQFVDQDGESIQVGGAPTFGIAWAQPGEAGPLRLVPDAGRRGRPPRRVPDGQVPEVAMDAGTASRHDFHLGDEVRILLEGPAREFRIVGLFGFGDRIDAGAVTFAAFDLETAQEAFGAPGRLDAVNVTAAPGADLAAVRDEVARAVGPAFDVEPATVVARDRGRQVLDFLALLTQLLLGFAAIGLVIGAFIIFNTFTILVTQRTRELGLLRAMGASGTQVVVSVVAEAAIIGLVASAIGIGVGIGLAAGLLALVGAAGADVPDGPVVLLGRTVIAALAVGVVVTVVSSTGPAVRAARVPPVAALLETTVVRQRPLRRRAVLGALLVAVGIPCLAVGLDRTRDAPNVVDEIWLVALGALLVFFGVVVALAALARSLAGLLGRAARVLGIAGVLARGNAVRNPRRTAATASALVIGLGLVGLVAVFGDSAKASVRAAVDRGIRADFVLKAQQFAGFSPQVADRLRDLPQLDAVAAFRFGSVRVEGNEETMAGVDPRQLAPVVDLGLRGGRIADMGDDGLLVHVDAAEEYGLRPGDTIQVQLPRSFVVVRVAALYEQADFTGGFPVPFVLAQATYDVGFGTDDQDSLVYVHAAGDEDAARRAIARAIGRDFPNVDVLTRSEYRDDQEAAIDRFLAVTVALLLLSEIIAVLGIVNTLALSVFERTRELGLLRSVGMTRRQMRRMIRGESVIVAVMGGVVGTAVGLFWGWAFTTALRSQGVTELRIPGFELAVFVLLSMLAGVVAALGPAWRAARLDVLEAIAAE